MYFVWELLNKERPIIFEQKYSHNSKGLNVFAARELYRDVNVKYILRLIWGGKGFAAKYRQGSFVIVACAFKAETHIDRQEAVLLSKQSDPC